MDWTRPTLTGMARFSARVLLVLGLVAVVGYVVTRLPLVFLSLFAALALTTLLRPVAQWLERRRVPRSLAALLVVLATVGLVGGALAFVIPRTVQQVSAHSQQLKQNVQSAADSAAEALPGPTKPAGALMDRASRWVGENGQQLAQRAAKGARATVEVLGGLLLAVVLTFFFVRDGAGLVRAGLGPLSPVRRQLVEASAGRAWQTLGKWLRGTMLVALIDAVGIGVGLLVLGVPLALPLAVLMFLSAFVPVLGAIVAGGVAVLVAFATGGPQDALITLGIVVAVQQLEGNVLEPVIMGRALPLHPALVLLAVTAGSVLAGVAGALVAVPLLGTATAAVQGFRDTARTLRARGVHAGARHGPDARPPAAAPVHGAHTSATHAPH